MIDSKLKIQMKTIDIENWNRKEHYEFFSKMANPYFGIVSEVDCTNAYLKSKELSLSFFAHYLHKSMIAVNSLEEFRSRIVDNEIVVFDKINAGATIDRADGTFAFIYVNFHADFEAFNKELQTEIANVKSSTGLRLNDDHMKKDLIRHSTLPWYTFSGLLHPTNFNKDESVPKITFGKYSIRGDRKFAKVRRPRQCHPTRRCLRSFHRSYNFV